MAYANGQFPTSATVALATAPGQRLEATAARQWDALARSVQSTYGWLPYLTDSYRPYAVQERIFRERYRVQSGSGPYGDVRYWQGQRWVRVTGAAAAVPGTSNHGWGKAVDCSGLGGFNGTKFNQLASLAARFGFSNTEGRSVGEAWHWVFTGSYQTSNPVGGGGSVTVPNVPGAPAPLDPEDDMPTAQEVAAALLETRIAIGGGQTVLVREALAHATVVKQAMFDGGSSMPGGQPLKDRLETRFNQVDKSLASVSATAAEARDTAKTAAEQTAPIIRSSGPVSLRQEVADTKTAVLALKPGNPAQVDVQELADALKSTLGAAVADELSTRLKG